MGTGQRPLSLDGMVVLKAGTIFEWFINFHSQQPQTSFNLHGVHNLCTIAREMDC